MPSSVVKGRSPVEAVSISRSSSSGHCARGHAVERLKRYAKRRALHSQIGFFVERPGGDQNPVGAGRQPHGALFRRRENPGGQMPAQAIEFGKALAAVAGFRAGSPEIGRAGQRRINGRAAGP
jgi:hypothetical protein